MYDIHDRPTQGNPPEPTPNPARLRSLAQLLLRLAREGALDRKGDQPSPLFEAQCESLIGMPMPWRKEE